MKHIKYLILSIFIATFVLPAAPDTFAQTVSGEGWLGITIRTFEPDENEYRDYGVKEGVLVTSVEWDSPAEEAGIKTGDVIVEFDGKDVYSSSQLTRMVRRREPGEKVEMVLVRDKDRKTVSLTLGDTREDDSYRHYNYGRPYIRIVGRGYGWLGISYVELNEKLGEYFQNTEGRGILITQVIKESPAEEAGLVPGDVIIEVNGRSVITEEELRRTLRRKGDEKVEITYIRKGEKYKTEAFLEEENYYFPEIQGLFDRYNRFQDGTFRFNVPNYREDYYYDEDFRDRIRRELRDRNRYKDEIEKLKEEIKRLEKELKDLKRGR